jgi:UDP-glucose 4-epimerase
LTLRILVTGSSGWLGQTLVPRLFREGHQIIGLDLVPSRHTQIVGTVADRELVHRAIRDFGAEAIVHATALHKPHIATHRASDFIGVNVQGTLNLLEEAAASQVERFVFTSTTSLMISREIRARASSYLKKAVWITENMPPLLPRNIYGVTKLSAEHLCRLFHELHGLPIIILRTARSFPEEDDMAHVIV